MYLSKDLQRKTHVGEHYRPLAWTSRPWKSSKLTRTSITSLQGCHSRYSLRVPIESRICAILETAYEAGYQGYQGKLNHAQAFASRAEKQHLASQFRVIKWDGAVQTFGCNKQHLKRTSVCCLNSWINSRRDKPWSVSKGNRPNNHGRITDELILAFCLFM